MTGNDSTGKISDEKMYYLLGVATGILGTIAENEGEFSGVCDTVFKEINGILTKHFHCNNPGNQADKKSTKYE